MRRRGEVKTDSRRGYEGSSESIREGAKVNGG